MKNNKKGFIIIFHRYFFYAIGILVLLFLAYGGICNGYTSLVEKNIFPVPEKNTFLYDTFYLDETASSSNNFFDDSYNNYYDTPIEEEKPLINIAELERRIHELINQERQKYNIPSLTYDTKLSNIARLHSEDMSLNNYFDHLNQNDEDPTDRANKAKYNCYKDYGSYYTEGIAENIFQNNLYDSIIYYNGIPFYDWNSLEEIAQSTITGWMNSPGHRENILTKEYDKEGIGISISPNHEVLITQNFC